MAKTKAADHDEHSALYQRGMAQIRKQLGPMADVLHPQHQARWRRSSPG